MSSGIKLIIYFISQYYLYIKVYIVYLQPREKVKKKITFFSSGKASPLNNHRKKRESNPQGLSFSSEYVASILPYLWKLFQSKKFCLVYYFK